MTVMLVLTAITGGQAGKHYTVTERVTRVGSAASNDLVLKDRQIEPRHIEIHQMLDRWFVIPLTPNSHGISLNGLPITGRSRLNAHDKLTLGLVTFQVTFAEMPEQDDGQEQKGGAVPRIGEYFVRRGLMTSKDIANTVQRQAELRKSGKQLPFGQIAYDLGYINRSQLDAALADQRNDFNKHFRD